MHHRVLPWAFVLLLISALAEGAEHPVRPGESPQAVLDRAVPGDRIVFLPGA